MLARIRAYFAAVYARHVANVELIRLTEQRAFYVARECSTMVEVIDAKITANLQG